MQRSDATSVRDASAPGWYPDPLGTDRLRLWDGLRWTDQLRARPTAAPRLNDAPAARAGVAFWKVGWTRRTRLAAAVIGGLVGTVIVVLALGSVGSPSRPALPVARPDCRLADAHPSATKVVEWFASAKLPVKRLSTKPIPGVCSAAAFHDTKVSHEIEMVIAYPTLEAATAAAAAHPQTDFPAYLYVVELGPGATARRGDYLAPFPALLATFSPTPPTTR
ncbi:MAG: DUF2510 domain-containing protein [Acidimicrobiales bacterium]